MDCNHNCESCEKECKDKNSFLVNPLNTTKIGKIIGIVSGKGGVGKSLITSLLAIKSNRNGEKTAIIDADITGPSIPNAFGLSKEKVDGSQDGLIPYETQNGIKIMSMNLLLDDKSSPVIWRGPIISGVVKQFYTDVLWGKIDNMFIDMPPGTGDVPLTVFQSLPINGIIIVTSPQELVNSVVQKAINMANMMNIKIYGIVENMSYYICPKCKEKLYIYGDSNVEQIAKKYNIKILGRLPIDSSISKLIDNGEVENINSHILDFLDKF